MKLAFAARATGDHRLNEDLVAVPAMATNPTGSKADVGPGDALNCFEALGFRSRWALERRAPKWAKDQPPAAKTANNDAPFRPMGRDGGSQPLSNTQASHG